VAVRQGGALWQCPADGTQCVADSVRHVLQLGKSLAGVSKGPKHLRGPKRSEHTDKKRVGSFCALVDACCVLSETTCDAVPPVLRSDRCRTARARKDSRHELYVPSGTRNTEEH
jgi:hypothetical protein